MGFGVGEGVDLLTPSVPTLVLRNLMPVPNRPPATSREVHIGHSGGVGRLGFMPRFYPRPKKPRQSCGSGAKTTRNGPIPNEAGPLRGQNTGARWCTTPDPGATARVERCLTNDKLSPDKRHECRSRAVA